MAVTPWGERMRPPIESQSLMPGLGGVAYSVVGTT